MAFHLKQSVILKHMFAFQNRGNTFIKTKKDDLSHVIKDSRLIPNSLTAAALWIGGDVAAQSLESRARGEGDGTRFLWDYKRTARMATMGLFMSGPMLSLWYRWMHYKTAHLAATPVKLVLAKMALDQCVFEGPYLGLNFSVMSLLEGKGLEEIKEKFQKNYWNTFKVDCCVWPVAQAINFSLVPVRYQTPFCSVVCVGWNCYLSLVNHGHNSESTNTVTAVEDKEVVRDTEKEDGYIAAGEKWLSGLVQLFAPAPTPASAPAPTPTLAPAVRST